MVAHCSLLSPGLHSALTLPECINTSASHEHLIITNCDGRDGLMVHTTHSTHTTLSVRLKLVSSPSDLSSFTLPAVTNTFNTHVPRLHDSHQLTSRPSSGPQWYLRTWQKLTNYSFTLQQLSGWLDWLWFLYNYFYFHRCSAVLLHIDNEVSGQILVFNCRPVL